MSQFNSIERTFAKVLSYTPWLKSFIKGLYQAVNYALHRQNYKYSLGEGLSLKKLAIEGKGSFGGYYDKSLLRDGQFLYHSFDPKMSLKNQSIPIDICLDGRVISSSHAWNWQQGSMLSWYGRGTDSLIHNEFDGKKFISKIVGTDGKDLQTIDFPVYHVSNCGSFALSLNFSRLAKLRPDYGYFNLSTSQIKPLQHDDGIYIVDLISNKSKLLIPLTDIAEYLGRSSMSNAWHKVNHIMISPNNKRFMFLHRWYVLGGKKFTRLMTCNIDGSDMRVLLDDGMVSHCWWLDDENIISYAQKKEIGTCYLCVNDKTGDCGAVGEDVLKEDGHPSFSNNGRWMITDTYPDRSRMRKLILFDMQKHEKYLLGEFFEPLRYNGPYRCDLHPRWGKGTNVITFDSNFNGVRNMYSLDLGTIVGDNSSCAMVKL